MAGHKVIYKTLSTHRKELDKLIDERTLKYGALRMKKKEVQAIKEIKRRLQDSEMQKQESLVSKGTTLEDCLVTDGAELEACLITKSAAIEACLVTEGATLEACLVNEGNKNRSFDHESTSSGNDADADIGPSYDSDTVTEVPHSSNDTFENVFAHGIQSHEQPESIPDAYEMNENNGNIIFDIPNMDLDRDKEEYDDVNREAQQANDLLTNKLERYKEKEKHFVKDMTIETESCKMIKLLNDEIPYLKSQACEKHKTIAKENGKFDAYYEN
nr:hypothetical protein [Tanacetum cinerariifolium]